MDDHEYTQAEAWAWLEANRKELDAASVLLLDALMRITSPSREAWDAARLLVDKEAEILVKYPTLHFHE